MTLNLPSVVEINIISWYISFKLGIIMDPHYYITVNTSMWQDTGIWAIVVLTVPLVSYYLFVLSRQ